MRTPRDIADAAKVVAFVHLQNAEFHARCVEKRFGLLSPEYAVAARVVDHEQAALVAAYDALLALDRGEARP